MSDPDVPCFASSDREGGTAEEDKAAMIGNLDLFGTYTVDDEGNLHRKQGGGMYFSELDWFPRIPRGNTMAPCVVVGERAAELLQKVHGA